jgi:hypothetical protein
VVEHCFSRGDVIIYSDAASGSILRAGGITATFDGDTRTSRCVALSGGWIFVSYKNYSYITCARIGYSYSTTNNRAYSSLWTGTSNSGYYASLSGSSPGTGTAGGQHGLEIALSGISQSFWTNSSDGGGPGFNNIDNKMPTSPAGTWVFNSMNYSSSSTCYPQLAGVGETDQIAARK